MPQIRTYVAGERHHIYDLLWGREILEVEAWERMTYGGILNEDGPGVYSLENCDTFLERTRLDPR